MKESKGNYNCKYCENDGYETPNKSIISKRLKNDTDVDLSLNVEQKSLCLWTDNFRLYGTDILSDEYILEKINYCPMCGRKLK